MTPDRRLDQLEPLMADSLQKIDRLIEGQGQIIGIATRADQNADTAARGVANLTISTQKQFDELRTAQEELKFNQEGFRTAQEELKFNQEEFRVTQEELKLNQEGFRITQEELKTKQDELKVNQEKLMAGQELILQILREKLL